MGKKKCEEKAYEAPENPNYVCRKCGRVSKKEEKVCKPVKISK